MNINLRLCVGLILSFFVVSGLAYGERGGRGGGPSGGGRSGGFPSGGSGISHGGSGSSHSGSSSSHGTHGGAGSSGFSHGGSSGFSHGSGSGHGPAIGGHTDSFRSVNPALNAWHGVHPAIGHLPGPGPHPGPHPNWYHGYWPGPGHHYWPHYGPAGWWAAGFATGLAFDAWVSPWSWGYWPYYNPYYYGPVVVYGTTVDYSQPIVMASPSVSAAPLPGSTDQATALDAARDAFLRGDYAGALAECDKAVAQRPNDTVAHEFRGLALFALRRYKEAAAPIYAVLSVGPGWDWATMSSFYPSVSAYTDQLRALEQYVGGNPNAPELRFLLAYHYMTCGHNKTAVDQLKAAIKLNPKDQLSAQLLSALTKGDAPAATAPNEPVAPGEPIPASKPIVASALVGDWKATRSDGATVSLSISGDSKYAWKFVQNGKSREFSGGYTVADNLLILKQGDNPMMIGKVTMLDGGQFSFKLPGDNPNDAGLTFGK